MAIEILRANRKRSTICAQSEGPRIEPMTLLATLEMGSGQSAEE